MVERITLKVNPETKAKILDAYASIKKPNNLKKQKETYDKNETNSGNNI